MIDYLKEKRGGRAGRPHPLHPHPAHPHGGHGGQGEMEF